ncbi:MAG: helix-turn-helix transcriptional regulator [Miniphocaeibacter sp.]|uniref:helix-turn-helix transcriptional regulator n=1 Tax=Miniphocaeibacter sp. TaxID=3100973 RepID=UPI003BB21B75
MKLDEQKILSYMAEKNWNNTMLSKESEVSRQTISYILSGKTCSPITAGKIAKALEIPVKEIMED